MKVELFSKSEVLDTVRYFAYPINNAQIIITNNYHKLDIVDINLKNIKTLEFEEEELINDSYFSDDKKHFLWNSEEDYLDYVFLDEKRSLNLLKTPISDEFSLFQYFVWDQNRFIIVALDNSKKTAFFGYDVNLHSLNKISNEYVLEKYPFFYTLFECLSENYLLYFNIKEEILVYRKLRGDGYEIFFQKYLDKKSIKLNFTDAEVHRANFLENILVLVHKSYLVFYYQGVEYCSLEVDKKDWAFRSAHLFKHNNDFYCLITQFDITQPKRNIIEVYKIKL